MKQITVLHIVDHMGIGGAQRIISELLRKWDKENIKLCCYALRTSNNDLDYENKQDFFTSNHKSKYSIFSFFELKRIIDTNDIEILHLHLKKSIIFGILLKMFYFKNIKLIIHEHGEICLNNLWYKSFLKVFQGKIDLFIAVSEATNRKLLERAKLSEKKIKILYNFVDTNKFNSDKIRNYDRTIERRKIDISKDDFVIGFAGRLSKSKGCNILLKSIPYINIQNFKVLIAGDGTERKQLEKLSEDLSIKDKIIFLGYVKDMIKFYSLIDCLVISSRSESFGLSAIEAHAMGIPVIASNIEGLNEVVLDKKTGLLFKSEDEKDLAEKIMLLYTDKKFKENLTKNALEEIEKYCLENYLKEIDLMYDGINKSNV